MNEYTKKLMNHFLIGVFAVIPIVVVLQIIIFVKELVSELFQVVYGFSDNYLYTAMVFAVSFIIIGVDRQHHRQKRPLLGYWCL